MKHGTWDISLTAVVKTFSYDSEPAFIPRNLKTVNLSSFDIAKYFANTKSNKTTYTIVYCTSKHTEIRELSKLFIKS